MNASADRGWSLRHTLLSVLMGLTLAVWIVSAIIVYLEARQESQELFDGSLTETAHLVLSLVENEVREHGIESPVKLPMTGYPNQHRYLQFQVLDAQGRVLYKNDAAPATALARDLPQGLSWIERADGRWRLCSLWNGDRQLQLVVAEPNSHRDDISSRFFYKIMVFGLLAAVTAAGGIWWVVNRMFRVLQSSADAVAARTPNDLAGVEVRNAPTEMRPLLQAINRLFDRVGRTMAYEQRFTADAAHELRTPLAAIKTNLQVLQRARNDQERAEFIAGLGSSVDRATRLVDQLLMLARLDPEAGDAGLLRPGDLARVLEDQSAYWQACCEARGLALDIVVRAAPCACEFDGMRMLLSNLVDNAMRYTLAPGAIVVECGQVDGRSFVRVADSGPGIAPEMRERVFERFVRLAGAHIPGSGLGLSIVRRIADHHGAQIELGSGLQGRGLGVTVRFPAASVTGPASP